MLAFKIALNYLLAEKKKTLIAFLVVSFGISMLVILTGFIFTAGFNPENIFGFETYAYAVMLPALVDSLLTSVLAIYNNLTSTINKRLKEITILKITGFSAKDIHNIFLSHGLFIGTAGTITGLFLGSILLLILSKFSFATTGLFKNYFSAHFSLLQYVVVFTIGIATTMIGAFIPLKKASALNPIKILNS